MSLQAPRTSVFTFQSAVHSAHVLQCLNEQRQRDVLCDVTVVVEDRSVRAHGSVLASCSDYFRSRITNATRLNPVITLPEEVTMEGFEPLLNFAYTSKLLFTKENIRAIHSSAEFLGFHNLETACFDFLIPKFSEGPRSSQEARRRGCCQKGTPDVGLGQASVESSQSELPEPHSSVPSGGHLTQFDSPAQCPHSTAGQGNREEENFSLENCGPQMPQLALGLTASDVCPILSSLPCPDSNKDDRPSELCERDVLDEFSLVDCALPCELSSQEAANPPHILQGSGRGVDQTVETVGAESNSNQSSCPIINPSRADNGPELLEQVSAGLQGGMSVSLSDAPLTDLSHEEGNEERSSVEREVAEHLAKGFWPDLCPSQTLPPPLDPIDQSDMAKASDFHWLKQLDLSSGTGDCPFLRDLGAAEEEQTAGTDSLFQSEKSPYMSSSLNSAEDTDLDTDGDSEANKKRAEEVQLPFPVEQISALSRNAFQQLLKDQNLTQDQLEFVHDVRRRSKNRVAAQRCRKRKLDIIHTLECEINTLRGEKERLLHERSHLKQNLEEARQSLSGLCRSVNSESGPEQDQFQIFAKISTPVLPALSLLIPMPSSSLLGKEQDSQAHMGMAACLSECSSSGPSVNSVQVNLPESNPQTEEEVPTPNCVPASILNACLDMDDNL